MRAQCELLLALWCQLDLVVGICQINFCEVISTVIALPLLQRLLGEPAVPDGEAFQDWKDQFELVAGICNWDFHAKLVNLVTRLCGQA